MTSVGCIDVGGTSLKVGVLDDHVRLVDRQQIDTPPQRSQDAHETRELIAATVKSLQASHDIAAVGVVVPGIVDDATGTAVWSENLRWRDVPFRDLLHEATGLPIAFGHDVRTGAVGEARLGAARRFRDSVFLAVGTGIAAGLIVEGRPVAGDGWAGEVGHADVGHRERCVCGLTGCLEAIASAAAIARRYAARSGRPVPHAEEVSARARAGDADAVAVWAEAVEALGFAIAWMRNVLGSQAVVLGGGLSRSGDQLLEPVRAAVDRRLSFQQPPAVVLSELGDQAACLGAGLLARDLIGPGSP